MAKAIITHRCTTQHGKRDLPCTAYRDSMGFLHRTCGEPCAWVMGKSGHGDPPWEGRDKFEPSVSDLDNVHQYMNAVGITHLKVTEKDDAGQSQPLDVHDAGQE